MFAQVIVDVAHSQVDKIFEYSCPDDLKTGSRVKVPFGNRVIDGFVIGVSRTSVFPPEKIKPVAEIYDESPALVPECFSLMERISRRYRVPKAASLRLFIPSEMRLGRVHESFRRFAVYVTADVKISKAAKKQTEALAYLKEKGEEDFAALCEKFGRGAINSLAEKGALKIEKRKIVRSPFKGLPEDYSGKILTDRKSVV